jgi:hypothetical protein
MGDGTLTLQDASTALATLDPAKVFGGSAFGPLRFRIINADGTKGDWQPLATLVRLPQFKTLQCPSASDQPCHLTGSNLFLVDAVSGDSQFGHPVQVPDGFPGSVLPVPHPSSGELFVKLRDDPSVVNQVKLTAENVGPAPAPATAQPQVTPIHPVMGPDGKPRPDYVRPNSSTAPDATPQNQTPSNPAPANQSTSPQPPDHQDQPDQPDQPAQNSTPPPANPQPQATDQSSSAPPAPATAAPPTAAAPAPAAATPATAPQPQP